MRRWAKRLGLTLAGLLVLVAGGIAALGLLSLPTYEGQVRAPGSTAPIRIVRDERAIPSIRAESERDAYLALGFVHGQDRLWQMELQRRVGQGRLAEVLGAAALPTDRYMRTLGLARIADQSRNHLDPTSLDLFQAYADGVNAAMASARLPPPELLILRHRPEPWRIEDSLLMGKLLALELAGGWRQEVLHARLLERLGPERVAQLFPDQPSDTPITLGAATSALLDSLARSMPEELASPFGSNVFVLSGERSRSGKPILASDPHLQLRMPGHWYLAALHAPDLNVAGGTIPGLPAVVIGRNRDVAWGLTNTGADTSDLFLEQRDPEVVDHYRVPGGSRFLEERFETIRVRDGLDEPLPVRTTRHGPIVSGVTPMPSVAARNQMAAFAWTALDPTDVTAAAGLAMARARDIDGLREALRGFRAPVQNIAMADRDGRIGMLTAGRIPVRRRGDGTVPVPGWTGDHDWLDHIPFEKLPQRTDPPEGVLFNANNRVVGDDYPYLITAKWDSALRARRLEAMLAAGTPLGVDDVKRIQLDITSQLALDMLPLLRAVEGRDAIERRVLAAMRDWQGEMAADRFEPLLFSAWYVAFSTRIYRDELGDLYEDFRGLRPDFVRQVVTRHQIWCDDTGTTTIESCEMLAAGALSEAIAALSAVHGADPGTWRWGEAHRARLAHQPFDRVPLLRWLYNRRPSLGGDAGSVNVAHFPVESPAGPFDAIHAAGLRIIADLATPTLEAVIATGQSGHPWSAHYTDLTDRWAAGHYVSLSLDGSASGSPGLLLTLLPEAPGTRQ